MNRSLLALHLLKRLGILQAKGRVVTLDDLADGLGVRRGDVRTTVTSLHHEGLVDAARMKLSLTGLAVSAGLARTRLQPLHASRMAVAAA